MIEVRRATPDDIPALVRLLGQLFAQEAEFSPDAALQARGLALILGDVRCGTILVAHEGARTAGMVNLLYTISTALGARVAILEDVVVDEGARGGGIGTRLVAAAIEAARQDGCRRITVLSDATNTNAHRFYERFGFTRSGMVPFRLALSVTRLA